MNHVSDEAPVSSINETNLRDRSIGDLIRDARNLSASEVEQVLTYQRENGVRFGEAAVALGLASAQDVINALSLQFHYPMGSADKQIGSPELVVLNEPFSPKAEAIRALRSQVTMRLNSATGPRSALAVISPQGGDGKTFMAANLAVALGQLGGRVLLVDADLRHPRQHDVLKVRNSAGLSAVLSGRTDAQVIQAVEGFTNLFVLPAGAVPPNPLELLERPAFGLLMRELAQKFDHVIVDTPAAEVGSDASVIAAKCGAALVLARQDKSAVIGLQGLVASLTGAHVQVLGAVLNEF